MSAVHAARAELKAVSPFSFYPGENGAMSFFLVMIIFTGKKRFLAL